jgi:ABC-type transport system involved in Fe-S cluster assembly fused permease/ATPase subunit
MMSGSVPTVVEEDGTGTNRRLHSAHASGMESSIFRFKDINFIVGSKDKQKNILTDVSGTIKWGHVLAVMGPSGMFIRSFTLHRYAFFDILSKDL